MLNARERRAAQLAQEVADLIGEYGPGRSARLLNVHRTTIDRWIRQEVAPPEAVRIALHAALGRLPGMATRTWEGWTFGRDGRLYSPSGRAYGAGDLMAQEYERALVKALQNRVRELEDKLARATQGEIPAANDGDLSVRRVGS